MPAALPLCALDLPSRSLSAERDGAAVAELVPGDALRVPIEAVSALLGPARAALQRVEGLSPQKER